MTHDILSVYRRLLMCVFYDTNICTSARGQSLTPALSLRSLNEVWDVSILAVFFASVRTFPLSEKAFPVCFISVPWESPLTLAQWSWKVCRHEYGMLAFRK